VVVCVNFGLMSLRTDGDSLESAVYIMHYIEM
jgi:hypothetical protein